MKSCLRKLEALLVLVLKYTYLLRKRCSTHKFNIKTFTTQDTCGRMTDKPRSSSNCQKYDNVIRPGGLVVWFALRVHPKQDCARSPVRSRARAHLFVFFYSFYYAIFVHSITVSGLIRDKEERIQGNIKPEYKRYSHYSKYRTTTDLCPCLSLSTGLGIHPNPTACTRWEIKELIIILLCTQGKTRQKLMSHSNARLITLRRRVRLFTLIPFLSPWKTTHCARKNHQKTQNCRFNTMKRKGNRICIWENKTYRHLPVFIPSLKASSTERLQTHRKNEKRTKNQNSKQMLCALTR